MTPRIAWLTLLGSVCVLFVAGCWGTPAEGPRIDARGNSGTVITNITDGSSSPIGTAPCGATSSQKAGENQPTGPDCSTTTVTNPPPEEPVL